MNDITAANANIPNTANNFIIMVVYLIYNDLQNSINNNIIIPIAVVIG